MGGSAGAPGKPETVAGVRGRRRGRSGVEAREEERARALEYAGRCSGRPKYAAWVSVFDRAPFLRARWSALTRCARAKTIYFAARR